MKCWINRTLCLLLGIALQPIQSTAQYTRFLLEFTDKHQGSYTLQDPAAYLSERAIERRKRYSIPIDSTDLPLSSEYIDSISRVPGVQLQSGSKWLNKVLVTVTDPAVLSYLLQISFVQSNRPVALQRRPGAGRELLNTFSEKTFPIPRGERISGVRREMGQQELINYGNSYDQIHIHEGEYLHRRNFNGRGILIAVLDGGFEAFSTNIAFDSIRRNNQVVGGYDFVMNQPGISEVDRHGSNCLSIMAANRPGQIVGSAPGASYLLLRTENGDQEYPIEEYFWARGAEYADSSGADIISSSLGYSQFDDPIFNHPYEDRDGNTCISTIAADLAAKKGIIVSNSAGNSGGSATAEKYISCPADGDSVLAVGAIQRDHQIAGFSSWGPNAAGKIKPNVVSIGQGTVLADVDGNAVTGNGTSYSNPNIAGLVACLWQAFPEFDNMDIIDAIQRSADRFANPDERFGYGIPNFRLAYERLMNQRNEENFDTILQSDWIKAFPNPYHTVLNIFFRARITGTVSMLLLDAKGSVLEQVQLQVTEGQKVQFHFKRSAALPKGIYVVEYVDKQTKQSMKVVRL
ncbi:MAG TPA: S8 family peptidase [Flavitalea sp.]|nr:S8 family peptidase [Flavitalea sp.]